MPGDAQHVDAAECAQLVLGDVAYKRCGCDCVCGHGAHQHMSVDIRPEVQRGGLAMGCGGVEEIGVAIV